jgi:glucose-6-phosphate 1-dehydrogenase
MSQTLTQDSSLSTNPLLEGLKLDKRAEPFGMVIFGAHGDLTKRKLLPALYALYLEDQLPKEFAVLGTSRTKMDDEQFRKAMKESVQKFASDLNFQEDSWSKFAEGLFYIPADVSKPSGFEEIGARLDELKKERGTNGNHIFYLSTAPSLYPVIVKGLAAASLATRCKPNQVPWPRVIIEKPFGHNLESAVSLDEEIHDVLSEHQVFRIDHYLGKETVQNIMVLRFANGIFEPLWNQKYVDHVQITNAETLGVEGRGSYYEEAGNLRDMVQNHLLQLVSLVGMEPPIALDPEATRDEKAKVLRCLRPMKIDKIDEYAVRGQYGAGHILGQAVPGYRQEEGVSPESPVETFTALKMYIDNWRWAGVPFYLRSGKRLSKSITEIAIHFKTAPHHLFPGSLETSSADETESDLSQNILVIHIQPEEGISLKFTTKQPGQTNQLRHLNMDFKYGTAFGVRSPTAYERLLHDAMMGDATLFSRSDQVEVAWKFIQPLLEHWSDKNNKPVFANYASGSWGPDASDKLIASTGHSWRRL